MIQILDAEESTSELQKKGA
ncbi:Protein of unknown function [Bacillus wiedmannii]|uniref:Uncharacterized protein n=1 Tax=Bacillus wiedmannii TaxID=1890302 RepID=A0A1C6WZM7_9BACI|nr:Protein of unknown function [Bacillus wiedmannii]SCL95423.1 Protein of unknown function [Bacillus wiedmannii]